MSAAAKSPPRIRSWECSYKGEPNSATTIQATSRGKAKREYFERVREAWQGIAFVNVRCRSLGRAPVTDDQFKRNAEYRQIPFARIGMRVKVGDAMGTIMGHNSSANLDVLFDEESEFPGLTLNCHPNWMITYYDDAGNVIQEFGGAQ